MKQNNTDPDLWDCIYKYNTGRGRISQQGGGYQWKQYASRTTMMTSTRSWRGHRTQSDGEGLWKGWYVRRSEQSKVHTLVAQDFAVYSKLGESP
jgi:hypothetical protein